MDKQNAKKIRIAIIVLAVLLAVSLIALAGVILYGRFANPEPTSVVVPGNIITPEPDDDSDTTEETAPDSASVNESAADGTSASAETSANASTNTSAEPTTATESLSLATALSLYNNKPQDNTAFKATNMFPGDVETKYYCVKVSYKGDIIVRYHADIREGYEKLAEVLKVKIKLVGENEPMYDGLMRDMPESIYYPLYTDKVTESELYYEISAYLDTSVGNEYQNKELIADFRWWVEETENLAPPQTGDTTHIILWSCLAVISLFLLVFLLLRRKKEGGKDEN